MKIVYKGIQKNKRDEDTKIFAVFKQKQADAVEITDEKVGEGETPSSPAEVIKVENDEEWSAEEKEFIRLHREALDFGRKFWGDEK